MFLDRKEISQPTRRKYYYRLRRFVAAHADEEPANITTPMLLDFINAQPVSEASKSILRQCFHAFFAFCGLEGANPAKDLPRWRDAPRRVILPNEQGVKLALSAAVDMCQSSRPVHVRDGLIFTLAVMGGNRRGEIRNLKIIEMIEALKNQEANGIYRVFTYGKTGDCILRFTDFHVPHLLRYLSIRPMSGEYVFVNLNPGQRYGQQLSLVAFRRVREKVCQRAGVGLITYQELRRRLATTIARTVNVDTAAHALNHSPHSGDRVIRLFYYDPDKAKTDTAVAAVFGAIG